MVKWAKQAGRRARFGHIACAVWSSLAALACSSPNGPTVTVVTGRPVSPSANAAISYYSQPITLVVTPGITATGASPATVLEVATDTAFATIVITKVVPPATNGQFTATLDRLSAATTYYWRVKSTAGSNPSVVSAVSSFTIGPKLVIDAPIPVGPLATTFPHRRPKITARNASRSGPPVTPTYTFEVSSDPAFMAIIARETAVEVQNQTSVVVGTDLVPGTTYFWRARASDAVTGVVGDYSPAQVFTTVFPDDGTYRYTLLVRSPPWCMANAWDSGGFCRPAGRGGWQVSDFSYDASLTIEADTLRYRLPDSMSPGYDAAIWEMRRTGERLEGSVTGFTQLAPWSGRVAYRGVISGQADNRGRFGGTLDGSLSVWYGGFPCDHTVSCSTSGFMWTLTPR